MLSGAHICLLFCVYILSSMYVLVQGRWEELNLCLVLRLEKLALVCDDEHLC